MPDDVRKCMGLFATMDFYIPVCVCWHTHQWIPFVVLRWVWRGLRHQDYYQNEKSSRRTRIGRLDHGSCWCRQFLTWVQAWKFLSIWGVFGKFWTVILLTLREYSTGAWYTSLDLALTSNDYKNLEFEILFFRVFRHPHMGIQHRNDCRQKVCRTTLSLTYLRTKNKLKTGSWRVKPEKHCLAGSCLGKPEVPTFGTRLKMT